MGLYGGVENAKYSEGGVYLDPGVFLLEIQACKTIKARNGKHGFVAEFLVKESSGGSKLKPGNAVSWMTMEGDNFLGNVKNFAAHAVACFTGTTDVDLDGVTEEAIESMVAESGPNPNPLKGTQIRASAVNVKTKKGTDFTKVKWIPFLAESAEVEAAHAENK